MGDLSPPGLFCGLQDIHMARVIPIRETVESDIYISFYGCQVIEGIGVFFPNFFIPAVINSAFCLQDGATNQVGQVTRDIFNINRLTTVLQVFKDKHIFVSDELDGPLIEANVSDGLADQGINFHISGIGNITPSVDCSNHFQGPLVQFAGKVLQVNLVNHGNFVGGMMNDTTNIRNFLAKSKPLLKNFRMCLSLAFLIVSINLCYSRHECS